MSREVVVIEQNILPGSQFGGTNGGSTGSITTVAGGSITPGEAFYLNDGRNPETRFEFADSSIGLPAETDLKRIVPFDGTETATEIRDLLIRKIREAPRLGILSSIGGPAIVSLLNRLPGVLGNRTPSASTVGGGFAVSAMVSAVAEPVSHMLNGVKVYDPATFGGVFDFPWIVPQTIDGLSVGSVQTWRVERILLQLTNAATWSLSIRQSDGTDVVVANQVGGNDRVIYGVILIGDERLVLVTGGATQVLRARIYAAPDRLIRS